MTALFRRPSKAERLLLYAPPGKEWERALDPGTLSAFVQRTLAGRGHDAGLQWEHARQLGLAFLREYWPSDVEIPLQAILRKGGKGSSYGLELHVDLSGEVALREYGEDLARALVGKPLLHEVRADVVVEGDTTQETSEQEVAVPVAQAPLEAPPAEPAKDHPASAPVSPEPIEVVMPGERTAPRSGRKWQQDPGDLFGLAGESHPDDQADHGLEIHREDLPWLNPGDAIISPRRGPCRIKRVEDEAGQVVAKDENGRMVVLEFRELLAEFLFDDGS